MGSINSFLVRRAPDGALAAPQYINARKLTANTAETVTVPTDADIVIFQRPTTEDVFWVRWDGSAASIPSADVTDGSGSEINPEARYISSLANFSIISPNENTIVVMLFYMDESEQPGEY